MALQESHGFLEEIVISCILLNSTALDYLATGIRNNSFLRKLSLKKVGISGNISTLTDAILNTNIELLDLSDNEMNDNCKPAIASLLSSKCLLSLYINNNQFTNCSFGECLKQNQILKNFGIAKNPLSFQSVVGLLEMLTLNFTLEFLDLRGISFKGTANIKENKAGCLTKEEAVILKFAYVLRYSQISVIGLDMDLSATMQLMEVEKSLVKYNSSLVKILNNNLSWKQSQNSEVVLGIQRALRSNFYSKKKPSKGRTKSMADFDTTVSEKGMIGNSTQYEFQDFHKQEHEMSFGNADVSDGVYQQLSTLSSEMNLMHQSILSRLSSLDQKLNTIENKVSEPQEKLKVLEKQIKDLRSNQKTNCSRLKVCVREIKKLKEQNSPEKFSTFKNLLKNLNKSLLEKIQTLDSKINKQCNQELYEKVLQLEETVYNQKARCQNLENELREAQNRLEKLEESNSTLEDTFCKVKELEQKVFTTPKKSHYSRRTPDSRKSCSLRYQPFYRALSPISSSFSSLSYYSETVSPPKRHYNDF